MIPHLPGFEIRAKHKEAIRQLYGLVKFLVEKLIDIYKLGKSTIYKILSYDPPERARLTRIGRPRLLSDAQVDDVIEYLSELWECRILNYMELHAQLRLEYTLELLELRLKQRGYYRCTACQKLYLTAAQVTARFIWAIAHVF